MSLEHKVAALGRRWSLARPPEIVAAAVRDIFRGRVAVVSSFGAESAVLLHLVATVDPATPVVFIDTGRHFDETLAYRDRLTAHLGLSDLRVVGPAPEEVARLDADNTRAVWDPDGCCAFRKIEPLKKALAGFDAWISGGKRFQAATRTSLSVFEADAPHVKVNPLAAWPAEEVEAYALSHQLPRHPLVSQGFLSIGCAPCTTAVRPGEHRRAGRWRSLEKTECGIHSPSLAGTDAQ